MDGSAPLVDAATDRAMGDARDASVLEGGAKTDAPPGTGEGGTDYDPCPPKGTACKIMPLGDSITQDVSTARFGRLSNSAAPQGARGRSDHHFRGLERDRASDARQHAVPARQRGSFGLDD